MKYIYKIIVTVVIFAGLASCDDYLDVNKDPGNPELVDLTPNDLLSAAESTLGSLYTTRMNQLGNLMAVAWSANFSDFADPFGDEFRYNLTSEFYDDVWDNIYSRTNNLTFIENFQDGNNWDNHRAIAKVLKAFYLQYIVDLYGRAPYSEIHEGTQNLFPKYDDQQSIYRALVDLIDEAVVLIDNAPSTAQGFVGSDVIFDGDMQTWKRFANTIKLRLLVRQTELAATDGAVNTYITSEFNELQTSGAQFLTTNAGLNPGYLNSDGKQNPFYARFGYNAVGNVTNGFRSTGPSAYSFNFLQNTSDPRINRLWQPNSRGGFSGTVQAASGGRPASFGPAFIERGVANKNVYLMLASESYFLQAEAVQRGYLTGSAQDLFNSGINASFEYLGISSDASAYITSIASTPNLGWTGNLIESIITQKYIALTSTSGIELWIEYNRTGFPDDLPLPNGSAAANIPVRLIYPASEYSGNTNNVPVLTGADAFTAKVFWDVN